jgi:hypothetical protein
MNLEREWDKTYYLKNSGLEVDAVMQEDGTVTAQSIDPTGETLGMADVFGGGVKPDIYALSQAAGAPVTEAEVAGTMGGAAAGVPGSIVTGFQDLGALIYGGGKALFAEEGQGVEEFLKGFSTISGAVGSEALGGLFESIVDKLNISDEAKQGLKQGYLAGEFASMGLVAPKAAKAGVGAVADYAAGAPARLEEAKSGVTLGMGVDPMTVLDETIVAMSKKTPPAKNSDLINVLNLRADQMKLSPKDRIQPSGENPLFDTTPDAYQRNLPEQTETPVPRAPEGAKLPLNNRAAKVVEMTPQIADKLAEKMQPYLGTPAQYFYNTGPIIDKAVGLGVPEDVARKQLKRFALNYAATSPRTQTEPNLRSASIVSAKETQGINYDEIVGPGGEGINEKGYPMMIQPASPGKAEGIHRKLIEAVRAGGIDYNTNPKPATFAENVTGNLAGVTVDTHAIRGALDAMNEVEPGSIPEGFIAKEFREQYKADPSTFNPATMVIDTLGDQKVGGVKMQTEYAVFSDLYKEAAKKLNVSPAEAQALGWFGSGKRTGLASDLKTVADLIDERVDVTAQALNRPKEEVFIDFFSGKIPLLSLGGLTLLDTGAITDNQEGADDGNI